MAIRNDGRGRNISTLVGGGGVSKEVAQKVAEQADQAGTPDGVLEPKELDNYIDQLPGASSARAEAVAVRSALFASPSAAWSDPPARPDLLAAMALRDRLEDYARKNSSVTTPGAPTGGTTVNLVGVLNKVNGLLAAQPPVSPSMGTALSSFLSNLAGSLDQSPLKGDELGRAIESAAANLRALGTTVPAPAVPTSKIAPRGATTPTVQLADFLLGNSGGVSDLKDLGKPLDAANRALLSSVTTLFKTLPPVVPMQVTLPVAMTFSDPQSGLKIDISKGATLAVDAKGVYTLTPPDVRVGMNGGLFESQNAKLVLGTEKDFVELGKGFVTLPDGQGQGELSNARLSAAASGETALTADSLVLDLTSRKLTGTGLNLTRTASTDTTSASLTALHSQSGGRTLDTQTANVTVAGGSLSGSGGATSVTSTDGLALRAGSFQFNLAPGPTGRGKVQATDLSLVDPVSGLSVKAPTASFTMARAANGSATVDLVLDGPTAAAGVRVGSGTLQGTGPLALNLGTNAQGVVTTFTATGSQLHYQNARTDFQLNNTAPGAPADPLARPVRLTGTSTATGQLDSLQAEGADLRWKQGSVATHATDATLAFTSLTGNPTAKLRARQLDLGFGDRGLNAQSRDLDCTINMDAAGKATAVTVVGRDGTVGGPFGSVTSTGQFNVDANFDQGLMSSLRVSTEPTATSTWVNGAKSGVLVGADAALRTGSSGTQLEASARSVGASDGHGRSATGGAVTLAAATDANNRLVSGTATAGSAQGLMADGGKLSGTGLGLTWSPEAVKATAMTGDFRSPNGLALSGRGLLVDGSYAAGQPASFSGQAANVTGSKGSNTVGLNGVVGSARSNQAAGTAQFNVVAADGTLSGQGWGATGQQLSLQGTQRPDGTTWGATGKNVELTGALDNGQPVAVNLAQASIAQNRAGASTQTEIRLTQGSTFKVNGVSVELPQGPGPAQDNRLFVNSSGRTISGLDLAMPGQVKAQVNDRGSLVLSGVAATAAQAGGGSALQFGVTQGQLAAKLNTNGTAGIAFSGLAGTEQVGPDGKVQFSLGLKDLDATLVDGLKAKLGVQAVGAQVAFTADQVLRARAGLTKLSVEQGDLTIKGVAADGRPTDVRLEVGADGKLQSAGATLSGEVQVVKGDLDLTVANGSAGDVKRNPDGSVEITAQKFGVSGKKGSVRVSADVPDADVLVNPNGDVVVKKFTGKVDVSSGGAAVKLDVASLRNALASYHLGNLVNDDTYLLVRPVTGSDGSIHLSGSVNMQQGPLKAKVEFHDLKQLEAMTTLAPNEMTLLLGDRTKGTDGWVKVSAMGNALTAEGSYVQARLNYSPMKFQRLNDALLRMADQKDVVGITPWLSVDPGGGKASLHAPTTSPVVADLTVMLGNDRGVYIPDGSDPDGASGVMMKLGARFGERRNEVSAFAGLLPGSTMTFTAEHGQFKVAGLPVTKLSAPTTAVGGLEAKVNDVTAQVGVFQNLARLTSTPLFIREPFANGLFGSVSTPLGKNASLTVSGSAGKDDMGKLGYGVAGVLKVNF